MRLALLALLLLVACSSSDGSDDSLFAPGAGGSGGSGGSGGAAGDAGSAGSGGEGGNGTSTGGSSPAGGSGGTAGATGASGSEASAGASAGPHCHVKEEQCAAIGPDDPERPCGPQTVPDGCPPIDCGETCGPWKCPPPLPNGTNGTRNCECIPAPPDDLYCKGEFRAFCGLAPMSLSYPGQPLCGGGKSGPLPGETKEFWCCAVKN